MSMTLLFAARRCAAVAPGAAVRRALGPGAARRLSDVIDAEVVRPYRAAGGTGPPPVNQRLLDVLEKSGPLDASAMWATVEAAQVRVLFVRRPPAPRAADRPAARAQASWPAHERQDSKTALKRSLRFLRSRKLVRVLGDGDDGPFRYAIAWNRYENRLGGAEATTA